MGWKFYLTRAAIVMIVVVLVQCFLMESYTIFNDIKNIRRYLSSTTNMVDMTGETSQKNPKVSQIRTQTTEYSTSTQEEYASEAADDTIVDLKLSRDSDTAKNHVAFLKVHKTGSSTVQNIFLRYAYERNLTLVLPHTNKSTGAETNYPNMISFRNTLNDNNIIPPPPGRHYDILCCHVIYNGTQFRKYMPADTSYIGLVRDPVTRLESAIRYFNMFPDLPFSDFVKDPLAYDNHLPSQSNNGMAFEFGFPLEIFPAPGRVVADFGRAVELYIYQLYNEFDLILINERLDDSLVYMKRMLGWHMKDVLYMKKLVSKKETRRFSDEEREQLKPFLYLDFALYEFAAKQFDSKFYMEGEDIIEEVNYFKEVIANVAPFCDKYDESATQYEVHESKWNERFFVTREDCRLLKYFETSFIQESRKRLYGTTLN